MTQGFAAVAAAPTQLDASFSSPAVAAHARRIAPRMHEAAQGFWSAAMGTGALTPRMRELVLLALHGTVTSLHTRGIERQVCRALDTGATELDVLDVLLTITGAANHALYFAVPVLMRELQAAGHADAELPPPTPQAQAIKDDFIRTRGFWNEQRDAIVRVMPAYFAALSPVSTASWTEGSLSLKERELVCIAIDCTVTHMFEPGLAIHIRNALAQGATREEILHVFQLASLTGLEGYMAGAEALVARTDSA